MHSRCQSTATPVPRMPADCAAFRSDSALGRLLCIKCMLCLVARLLTLLARYSVRCLVYSARKSTHGILPLLRGRQTSARVMGWPLLHSAHPDIWRDMPKICVPYHDPPASLVDFLFCIHVLYQIRLYLGLRFAQGPSYCRLSETRLSTTGLGGEGCGREGRG